MHREGRIVFFGEAVSTWRGKPVLLSADLSKSDARMSLGEWEPLHPDRAFRRPTIRGCALRPADLPRLLAAVQEAEAWAIREGHLRPQDYVDAGVPVPDALRPSVA